MRPRLKLIFGDHNVATVHEQGWDALEDGPLLTVAQNDFDVLVTIDKNLELKWNVSRFRIGVIVVHSKRSKMQRLAK
jgi:hypothetical protein